jgi:hypothetical protein
MAGKHLTLYDFRDLDLMLKLDEVGGASGASTKELAESIGFDDDAQAVGQRAAWMRRFGMFDFDEERRLWTLSEGGERVVAAKLKAAQAKTIDTLPDEQLVDVMAHVTTRYRLGDPIMATMLRREFAFGTNPRSAAYNGHRRRR